MSMRKFLPLAILILSSYVFASELRCGWLQNPTPANQWLIDKDGTWDISLEGGYSAPGIEKLKDFPLKPTETMGMVAHVFELT